MPSSGFQTCALRSEEHTSELQSHDNLVCRLLLAKSDVHLVPTPGHTLGACSVALEDGDTVFFFAADASSTERLMVDCFFEGDAPPPARPPSPPDRFPH